MELSAQREDVMGESVLLSWQQGISSASTADSLTASAHGRSAPVRMVCVAEGPALFAHPLEDAHVFQAFTHKVREGLARVRIAVRCPLIASQRAPLHGGGGRR